MCVHVLVNVCALMRVRLCGEGRGREKVKIRERQRESMKDQHTKRDSGRETESETTTREREHTHTYRQQKSGRQAEREKGRGGGGWRERKERGMEGDRQTYRVTMHSFYGHRTISRKTRRLKLFEFMLTGRVRRLLPLNTKLKERSVPPLIQAKAGCLP